MLAPTRARPGPGERAMSTTVDPAPGPGPVQRGERIDFLDSARGLALLGILFVNIQAFAEPFGRFIDTSAGPGLLNRASFAFVKIFCEGKFYPLFSLLFGIGLAIQWTRAHEAGRRYRGQGLRRLLFLMVLGAAHAFLLWYGDILLTYSICGLMLLPALRLRPATLATIGGIILAMATLLSGVAGALMQPVGETPPAAATTSAPTAESAAPTGPATGGPASSPSPDTPPPAPEKPRPDAPFLRLLDAYERGEIEAGPDHPIWMEQETRAFRDGPFLQAFYFRALLVGLMLVFTLLGFGWSIIAMFFFGAAMWKSGRVAGPGDALSGTLLRIGLPLGLAGSIGSYFILETIQGPWGRFAMGLIGMPAALLISVGYFCAVKHWVQSGRAAGLARLLANVGRFGLTNYILQTVLCTFIFYHWGLAQFGQFTRPERMAVVVGVYLFQVILSAILARVLVYGPLEWVWRTFTYLRPQPFLKRSGRAG